MPIRADHLLVHGDAICATQFASAGSVDLAYLDPPFAVGVTFGARTHATQARADGPVAYDDRWPSLEAYLTWLEARVRVVHTLLSAHGTMWLHLDHRAVHHAAVMADRIFGRSRRIGEVIWAPGNGSKSRKGPGITHQTLLVFTKTDDFVWNADDPALREPFAKTSLSMHFKKKDASGRAFRDRTINGKTYRYYADEGRALGTVWNDCPAMVANTPLLRETTGYPTQKPEKLLERIVRASSEPGALVLDPFSGSGTTLVVAARLGRKFLGLDIGAHAIDTATARLRKANVDFVTRQPLVDPKPRAKTARGSRGTAPTS